MAKSKIEKAREFAGRLAEAAGDNVHSVLLFGAQARKGYAPSNAGVNLFLILHDASTGALRPLEPELARWARSEPSPVIVSLAEWKDSTDVFPIEFDDMREAHEVLTGIDPFDGLATTPADVRHELERELRGKLLQLRSQYASVATDGKALTRLLLESVETFFVLMRALVRLVGGEPGTDPATLVSQVAEAAHIDAAAFDWVVRKISGDTVRSLKPNDPVGARYVDAIETLAAWVDQYGPSGSTATN